MPKRLSPEDRRALRAHSLRFLEEGGFGSPPLSPGQALHVRQLSLFPGDLQVVLADLTLEPEITSHVDALLQVPEKLVAIRRSISQPQQRWGCIHEVAHDYLPWHRELLYCCSILMLPPEVRNKMEMEADVFAAEAFFFGGRFSEEARDYEFGLIGPKELAERRYLTSYYATFRRYVEDNERPCYLLVWQPVYKSIEMGKLRVPESLVLKYYVKSPSFRGHFEPGQEVGPNSEIWKAFVSEPGQVRKHTVRFRINGKLRELPAESFSNSYTLFTLALGPMEAS